MCFTANCVVNLKFNYDFKCLNNKSLLDWIRIGELDELMASTTIRTYVNELSCGSFLPKELTWSITNWRMWLSIFSFGFLAPALLNTQATKIDENVNDKTNQSNGSRPGCCRKGNSIDPETSDSGLERKHSQLYVIEYYEYESVSESVLNRNEKNKDKTNNSGHKTIQIRWGNFWKDIFSIDLEHGQEEGDIAHSQDPQDDSPEPVKSDFQSSKKSRVWTPNWLSEYMLFITTPKIVSAFLGISLT